MLATPETTAATKSAKTRLRQELLQKRAAVPPAKLVEVSKAICAHLATWLQQRHTEQVFLYAPMESTGEPDLLTLPARLPGVEYALPVTTGRAMTFFPWRPGEPLQPGRYGILEPERDSSAVGLVASAGTVILVPCLALARSGVRLGYGGGFFDRYLAALPKGVVTVGVAHYELLLDELPGEPHDIPVDFAVSEQGVIALR